MTVATIALLLLVDLDQREGLAELLSLTVTLLAATALFLAVAAAGVVSMLFSDIQNGLVTLYNGRRLFSRGADTTPHD